MQFLPDNRVRLDDGTELMWLPDAELGAIGLVVCSAEPLDAAANVRIADLFQVFLGAYRAQGADIPYLLVEATHPTYVERRFNLLVHEFKWINFYGGGLGILQPSPIVRETFTESAVAGYIPVFAALERATALATAIAWFRQPTITQR